jgi:hypothetical protein
MRRLPLALLLALATASAGCAAQQSDSSDDFSGAEGDVAQVVEDLEQAGASGDEDEVCGDVLTKDLAAKLKAGRLECSTLLDDALDDVDVFDLKVDDVTLQGPNAATAVVTAGSGKAKKKATLGLVRDKTGWRISDLGS